MSIYAKTIDSLKQISSKSYKEFSEKIARSSKVMLGVKIPTLKKIASDVLKLDYASYLSECKFEFFEDTLLFGLIIARLNYKDFLAYLPTYLSNADSWSHIDSFVSAITCVKNNSDDFFEFVKSEIFKAKDFHLRFFIVCLMSFYLQRENLNYIFDVVEKLDGNGYYNDMAIAWLISIAYVKFKDETFEFIKTSKLSNFTLNKAISKINDSLRVTRENKILLQNYTRKIKKDGHFKNDYRRI